MLTAAEISAIERQKNIGRCQGAEENRSVLLHWKHCGFINRQHVVDDHELAPQPQPRRGDRCRKSVEIADCLLDRLGRRRQQPLVRSCKTKHRPGCAFCRRGSGDHDARIQEQPHGCSRRRRISASSSAIQRAISSTENARGSGSVAPSARSREARKSINSCFSAGESETAATSISASVTMRTSVYASMLICKDRADLPPIKRRHFGSENPGA